MDWFPSACKSDVYIIWLSIKCAIALCLKECIHVNFKNTLLLKHVNHHVSFLQVITFLLVEGLASILIADD